MTLRVVFRRAAKAEFEEAVAWYGEKSAGLADEFMSEIYYAVTWCGGYAAAIPRGLWRCSARCCAARSIRDLLSCSFKRVGCACRVSWPEESDNLATPGLIRHWLGNY